MNYEIIKIIWKRIKFIVIKGIMIFGSIIIREWLLTIMYLDIFSQ